MTMRVKPVDPAAVIRDPNTKRQLPAEGGDVPDDDIYWTRRWLAGEVWKREGDKWARRLPSNQTIRVKDDGGLIEVDEPLSPPPPVGDEPLATLSTRAQR
jgi:hypothetical protein